ncbi:PREDICTED: uncharacterized oxidoreductase C663.06c [Corvus brachyrhynchos]|uniref:uncharacterized oxidoreductase C663.06c n=1 Tax=Corvus brachyrhynchos TaxID=85066 RepID=UPI0008167CFA|nr:PREDICTED: uncharacterized oxidoreductase C663.06c [Corvus brachyrhynchos]
MAGLHVRSLLVTGANRGIGLGLVQHFLRMPNPPQWIFAGCRSPKGQRAQELQNLASKHPNVIIIPLGRCLEVGILCPSSSGGCPSWAHPASPVLGGSCANGLLPVGPSGTADSGERGKRREDDPVLVSVLPTVEGAAPLPCAMSVCAPVPSVSLQAFLPLLKKAAQGSPGSGLSCSKAAIINISSIGGSFSSFFTWDAIQATSYRCSKAALNMLSKCQSLAYREHGVLCVALHPGWVQTDMGSSAGHTPPVTVDDSVQGMLKVLSSLSEKETGTFLDWEGNVIPW